MEKADVLSCLSVKDYLFHYIAVKAVSVGILVVQPLTAESLPADRALFQKETGGKGHCRKQSKEKRSAFCSKPRNKRPHGNQRKDEF